MIKRFKTIVLFALYVLGFKSHAVSASSLVIDRLFCEYLDTPQTVDSSGPVFGWILKSNQRGQKQIAYQVLVADSQQLLAEHTGNCWDSGKVLSSESSHVVYAGRKLAGSSDYYWKVRVWDKDGLSADYSTPSHFGTALMSPERWKASWIGRGLEKEPVVRWGTDFASVVQRQ